MKKWSEVAQSCLTLCDPVDYSLSGSSVSRQGHWNGCHFFPQGSSRPRDRTQVSSIAGRCFTVWATSDALHYYIFPIILKSGSERPTTCCFFFFFPQYSFGYLESDEISCHFMLYFIFLQKSPLNIDGKYMKSITLSCMYKYVCIYVF